MPLTTDRHVPGFLRDTMRVRRQLRDARADPHRAITTRVPTRMGATAFRTFTVVGADVPVACSGVRARLAAS